MDPALLDLAPLDLPNHRRVRYDGDDLHVAVDRLASSDGAALRVAYAALSELLDGFADLADRDADRWGIVEGWRSRPEHGLTALFDAGQRLGTETLARDGHDDTLAKVLHDVRGGALSALLGRLQLLDRLPRTGTELKMIFALTRDHLKIMRNSVTGLDDRRREFDRLRKSHAVKLILEKWHDAVVGPFPSRHDQPPRRFVDSRYDGALTECCLESAAMDRIFYNLAANACRHCAPGGRLDLTIFPLPPDGKDLRFVLSNPVSPEDATTLCALGAS